MYVLIDVSFAQLIQHTRGYRAKKRMSTPKFYVSDTLLIHFPPHNQQDKAQLKQAPKALIASGYHYQKYIIKLPNLWYQWRVNLQRTADCLHFQVKFVRSRYWLGLTNRTLCRTVITWSSCAPGMLRSRLTLLVLRANPEALDPNSSTATSGI